MGKNDGRCVTSGQACDSTGLLMSWPLACLDPFAPFGFCFRWRTFLFIVFFGYVGKIGADSDLRWLTFSGTALAVVPAGSATYCPSNHPANLVSCPFVQYTGRKRNRAWMPPPTTDCAGVLSIYRHCRLVFSRTFDWFPFILSSFFSPLVYNVLQWCV